MAEMSTVIAAKIIKIIKKKTKLKHKKTRSDLTISGQNSCQESINFI
jgi:hypothetical protein